jgi:hypothetical protein
MDNTLSSLNQTSAAYQSLSSTPGKITPADGKAADVAQEDKKASAPGGDRFEKSAPAEEATPRRASGKEKEYTVLAYLDGCNNLEDCILQNVKELESIPQSDNMNIVVQFSRFHTKGLTVMFLAEALTQAFKSKDFKAVLEQIVQEPELIKNYGEILKDEGVGQQLSQILLERNPELNEKLDKFVTTKVKESMGQNRAFDAVIKETAVEMLKGVYVNEAIAAASQEGEEPEKSIGGGGGPIPVTLSAQAPTLLEIMSDDKKESTLGELLAKATGDLMRSTEGKGAVGLMSAGGTDAAAPGGNVFFVESGNRKGTRYTHEDYSDIFGGVEGVDVNREPAWRGVRRYEIQHSENTSRINSPVITDLGQKDMSASKTLSDFVAWGMKKYPATHYIVLLSDHGAGFLGAEEDRGSLMSLPAIKEAFEKVKEKTGKKPDIIAFDTCLMAQAEVAYELKDSAKFLVASEEVVGGEGYPYTEFLPAIDEAIKEGKTDPKDITRIMIEAGEEANDHRTMTLSAIDLQAAGKVADAANTLAKHILEGKAKLDDVRDSIKHAQNFSVGTTTEPYSDFRDLWDLADKMENNPNIKNREIKKDLKEIKRAVEEAVVHEEHKDDEDYEGAHGMSIYAPRRQKSVSIPLMEKYDEVRMSKRTKWNELIKELVDFKELEKEEGEEGARKLTFIPLPPR